MRISATLAFLFTLALGCLGQSLPEPLTWRQVVVGRTAMVSAENPLEALAAARVSRRRSISTIKKSEVWSPESGVARLMTLDSRLPTTDYRLPTQTRRYAARLTSFSTCPSRIWIAR